MSDGNGLPNTADTRARLRGLSVLDRALAEQLHSKPPPEPTPSRSMRVEAAMQAIEDTERERDELRRELDEARTNNRGLQAEVDALMLANSRVLTEMERHQRERDDAVSRLAAIEAVYDAVLTIMQKHRGAIPRDMAEGEE